MADALRDGELAMIALEEIMSQDRPVLASLWSAPYSDLRQQPRFKALLERLGIADFYRATGQWGDFCRPLGENDFICDL